MSVDSFALSGFLTTQDGTQFGALGAGSGPGGLPPNHPSIPPKLRKRTKTGCLTCRKRRIKCGEERPTCNNCVKSKRHCEGYAQRIHFKAPFADWPNAAQSPTGQDYPPDFLAFDGPSQAFTPHRHVPPPISTQFDGSSNLGPQTGYLVDSKGQLLAFSAATPTQPGPFYPEPQSAPPHMQTHPIHPVGLMGPPLLDPRAYGQRVAHSGAPMASQNFAYQASPLQSPPLVEQLAPFAPFSPGALLTPEAHQAQNEFFTTQSFTPFTMPLASGPPTTTTQSTSADTFAWASSDGRRPSLWSATSDGSFAQASPQVFVDYQGRQAQAMFDASRLDRSMPFTNPLQAYAYAQPLSAAPQLNFPLLTAGTTQILDNAAIEHEDDDYYDVQSDEEIEDVTTTFSSPERSQVVQQTLSAIMRLHQGDLNELTMRTYNDFIHGGILDHYRAERTANPLRNPMTARVFAHFITATGPTMSMFERLPRNASALIDDDQGGTQQQHSFWTYTLPAMALNNQAVLHAMLALSSLHIAKLQGASVTPSYKHYAYSLKRLRRCLGHPSKRHLATTLAATLILGFYEVLTADHLKWNSHLMGASLLASEIDLRAMTREARQLRRNTSGTESSTAWRVDSPPPRHDDLADVDENLISTLSGMKVDFDGDSHFTDPSDPSSRVSSGYVPPSMDLNQYNVYQDLVWWYLKQDLYQSIISGNPLLFSYQRWTDCPPRARCNRHDAVYGTFDHCILILGRIADFAVRDKKRKIEVITSNGGQWRPHPSMTMPKPPGQGGPPGQAGPPRPGGPQQPGAGPPQPPPFYGMAPTPSKVQVPASFVSQSHSQSLPAPTPSPEGNPEEAMAAALREWTSIRTALAYFEKTLGPAFQPLPEEFAHHQSLDPTNSQAQDPRTVFGAVIQYQSYDIAVLWAFIQMAYIILIRSHPYMPPAAMMAAGIAAKQTAPYAQKIGQIAIGIVPPPHNIPLNPSIGATLCEVSIPLFFAGVQYQAPQQRDWLVSRIRHVERRTGWASVGMIAHGCETAWRKAAEMGRGPPYTRKEEAMEIGVLSSDDRIRKRGEIIVELGINVPNEGSAGSTPNQQLSQAQGQLPFDFNAPVQSNDLGMSLGAMHMGGLQARMHPQSKGKQPMLEDEPNPNVNLAERRYIHVNLPTRLHWAMGILSEQEDV